MTDDIKHVFTKNTIIEKYQTALINQKEVRRIDSLIYWAIILPLATYKYEVLKEYTKLEDYVWDKTKNEEGKIDYVSDDLYLRSKNIATCVAVDDVKKNEKYYLEEDDKANEDDTSEDTILGGYTLSTFVNIALKARFTFSESTLKCPCTEQNEYYFRMHNVQQPEHWCAKRNKNFKSLKFLLDHLEDKSCYCHWHMIYYIFYKTFIEQEDKRKR